jgi:uncharacterized protein YcbX
VPAALHVTRVRTYPVKSLAGNDVNHAVVEPWGLAGDRRWALVDEGGVKVTAIKVRHLLGLRAEPTHAGGIRIFDSHGEHVSVDAPVDAPTAPVGFSRLPHATPAASHAHEWVSQRIGLPLRLVWQQHPHERSIAEDHGGLPGESLSLADAAPVLLAAEASLRQLNEWTGSTESPLDIVRFRPNVVVNGVAPFAEDHWHTVRIGEVTYRKTQRCDRCAVTTIDPGTLVSGKEPIRTLARHRRADGKTWFGIRLTPVEVRANSMIAVGDRVEIVS